MKKSDYLVKSFINAGGVLIYVSLVAWVLSHGQAVLGNKPDNFLMPVMMLLLLIISASITGFLVLGKPILMYWDGRKKEALVLLFSTLAWLAVFLAAVAVFLINL